MLNIFLPRILTFTTNLRKWDTRSWWPPNVYDAESMCFKNCDAKTFLTPFSGIFLSYVVVQNFSKEVSRKTFDQRTVLFIYFWKVPISGVTSDNFSTFSFIFPVYIYSLQQTLFWIYDNDSPCQQFILNSCHCAPP